MKYPAPEDAVAVVGEFIRSFNERDLDAFVGTLDPEVELHSGRGLRRGVGEARSWATREPGGAQQTILVDEIYRPGPEAVDLVIVAIDRVWIWEEDGSPAGTDEMEWLFELNGGRIRSWKPFERRGQALEQLAGKA